MEKTEKREKETRRGLGLKKMARDLMINGPLFIISICLYIQTLVLSIKEEGEKHLRDSNATYFEHAGWAFEYFYLSAQACFYFLMHMIIPGIFVTSGSDTLRKIIAILDERWATRDSRKKKN